MTRGLSPFGLLGVSQNGQEEGVHLLSEVPSNSEGPRPRPTLSGFSAPPPQRARLSHFELPPEPVCNRETLGLSMAGSVSGLSEVQLAPPPDGGPEVLLPWPELQWPEGQFGGTRALNEEGCRGHSRHLRLVAPSLHQAQPPSPPSPPTKGLCVGGVSAMGRTQTFQWSDCVKFPLCHYTAV